MMRAREITFKVELDEHNLPSKMTWSASDSRDEPSQCKAFLISLWDEREAGCLRIDLWTKEMRVDEMSRLFHQTLATMADTYQRATNNQALAGDLKEFAATFGKRAGIIS
jgi:gliding motility-associated protein GldC